MNNMFTVSAGANTDASVHNTCISLSPLESESDVSLYIELVTSTSVEARLRFFNGLHESEISLAPKTKQKTYPITP